jgi:hypothetical protein
MENIKSENSHYGWCHKWSDNDGSITTFNSDHYRI